MIDIQAEFKKRQEKLRKTLDDVYVRHKVRSWFDEPNKKTYLQALDEGGIKSLELAKELTEQGSRFYEESNYKDAVDSFRRALQLRTRYYGQDAMEIQDSLYQYGVSLIKMEQGRPNSDNLQLQKSFDSISKEFPIPDSHKPSVSIALFLKALAEGYAKIGDFGAAKERYRRACIMSLGSYRKDGPITPLDITEMYFQTGVCVQSSGGDNVEALYYYKCANREANRILFDLKTTKSERERIDGFHQRLQNLIVELEG